MKGYTTQNGHWVPYMTAVNGMTDQLQSYEIIVCSLTFLISVKKS